MYIIVARRSVSVDGVSLSLVVPFDRSQLLAVRFGAVNYCAGRYGGFGAQT